MKKILKMSIINIPKWTLIKRIIANIISFLLLLIPAYLTRYLTDEMIENERNIPYYWLLLVVVATFVIHIFIFYFVNYKGQIFANQLAQDFEVKLMQKVISSSNPEYEKESKSKIFNMHNNDIYSIYSLSNYLTMIPVDILEVIVIVGILFNVNYIIAFVAILLAPLYVMSSFVNKKKLNELVADEKMAADEWIGETETIINGKDGILLRNVQMLTADGNCLFNIDNFNADKNGLILVRGENGCGKTTLLNVLSGIFDSTHIKVGENGSIFIAKELCEDMTYLFYPDFLVKGTVKENVLCGRNIPEGNYRLIEKIFELPDAEKEVVLRPENLSLGEKQKIYLSRILIENKRCILLDEPGSNLDEKTEESLIQYLGQIKNNSLIIVISHNSKYDKIADKIYNISNGGMILTKKLSL